jgi:hypothetical protein
MRKVPIAKTCPTCKLINPPEAERCDCGWDFKTARQARSYLPANALPLALGVGAGTTALIILVKLVIVVLHMIPRH